jgi:hypothetical protein
MEGEAGGSPSIAKQACPVLASPDRTRLGLFRSATGGVEQRVEVELSDEEARALALRLLAALR